MDELLQSPSTATYEATQARQSTWAQPDKIHWTSQTSYRNSPYRHLHHQKGLIGTFTIRLLEASDLKRSYWSALALGPVKHLGLSKAHGPISSFCQIKLANEEYTSPVVANNDSPTWEKCCFDLSLKKAAFSDGAPISLSIKLIEDATAAEQMGLPGVPSLQDRLLGTGNVDVTSLCLGQDPYTSQAHVGVLDVWIPIYKDESETGRVRLLVQYQRHGMEPQVHDLVALEAFSRKSLYQASCRPFLLPLEPMRVLQKRGDFLLVQYTLPSTKKQATMRLHVNAVFVLERTNLVDGAVNVVLTPIDFCMNTPLGRTVSHVAGPLVEATGEMMQPLFLSSRLLWGAVRTTTFASVLGVQAATGAVWQTSREAQERRDFESTFSRRNSDDDSSKQQRHLFV